MEEAHDHLDISREEFATVADHLDETLESFDVDEADREAILSAVASYEDEIVTAAAD